MIAALLQLVPRPLVFDTPSIIVMAARDQLRWDTGYTPEYERISYPGGDVLRTHGVCTDVVVRSLRAAGYDLQVLIHRDRMQAGAAYRQYPDPAKPDPNIDHRRVLNQRVFFRRYGRTLSCSVRNPAAWHPGDIVQWKIRSGRDHTGILTDRRDADGFPYVIHKQGAGPREANFLRTPVWRITAHFHYPR